MKEAIPSDLANKQFLANVLIGIGVVISAFSCSRSIKYYRATGTIHNNPLKFWLMRSRFERILTLTALLFLVVGLILNGW
jgi:hypothetical protein